MTITTLPEHLLSIRDTFGLSLDGQALALQAGATQVPAADPAYRFNPEVTQAILAGFTHNRRVLVQGRHGTGKSTHIEQVAARLNWPCLRVNLDGHLSRLDLVGKDTIQIQDGLQVTGFQEGLIPWAMQRPMALILDEYDAGRPDILFVVQQLLEPDGGLTLMDQNRVIRPHPQFRIFATANTLGLGDTSGLYHGTQLLNHAQLDRWNVVARLDYLLAEQEMEIVLARVPDKNTPTGREQVQAMVALAALTRHGFACGDLSTLMSPRTVITWAQNHAIFHDLELAFRLSFLNKCDLSEHPLIAEYYQRCFGTELTLEPLAAGQTA
ncbi:AAA family ATPase [Alcaligenes sp. SDU_A2]|uniref:AAA family ATPase n=1 Tax=Alcaligenes sp. SDU_A2 TaxID=3136634 RepID=UPI00311E856C